ncbi:DUF2138 domain-containing protein [Pseudomonas sp. GV071]|uniref:DUF2138 domain-containing protein n=1 Tax=Pseudomonas sp. GV071 TaxID=2135754 RepID=UPI000D3782CF|nr:DUF2138 domain-containing protein [Pseudomonas sp. GV071]PTQ67982.1 uncharacterized protein YfaA (DUF2138 family) [Pseudomonas sp. GV071]
MSENTTQNGAASPQEGKAGRKRRVLIAVAIAVPLFAGAGILGWWQQHMAPPRTLAENSELQLDLQHPQVLIESESLSRLPKDLLAVPLLRDTLTEDLVFYYEANPDRLGITGSLRRIIYEHDLELQDTLLEQLLDQPAQVALWRGADGKLKNFMVLMERGGLARLLEPLAHVAADDTQLRQVAELRVDGDAVPLYRLRYNGERALLFASYGDKLVMLSNPGMLLESDSEGAQLGKGATEAVEAMLNGEAAFTEGFGLKERGELKQRISLGSDYVAMGYQRFIPSFAGLRFEMDGSGWHSYLALSDSSETTTLDFNPIWRAMPMGASACVALPVAPAVHEKMLAKVGAEPAVAKQLSEHLTGAAGLCWYPNSRLHSPLLVGQLDDKAGSSLDENLGKLFGSVIGAWESNVEGGIFPVSDEARGDGHSWQREVSSNFGQYPTSEAQVPDAIVTNGFFRISLVRHGSTLLFSLDDTLVNKGLDALDKRFPPLADVLPKDAVVPAYLAPNTLSTLFEQETLDALPSDMEPVFRNAAQTLLLPKLKALAGHNSYALTLPADAAPDSKWQWLPLEWRSL